MPKRRISRSSNSSQSLTFQRFIGISLGGGKTNKTAVAVIDFYKKEKKLFLRSIQDKVQGEKGLSSDEVLLQKIESQKPFQKLAIDVPIELPKCLRCSLKCYGYEKCKEPEIVWMWKNFKKSKKRSTKNHKIFTPYTERCMENYMKYSLPEKLDKSHALGANMAPLTARGYFLKRRFRKQVFEVYPLLSLLRIGNSLKMRKSYLKKYKHSVEGLKVRKYILEQLEDQVFFYQKDRLLMEKNAGAFEAFLCAMTLLLKSENQCEKPSKDFPFQAQWTVFPVTDIDWSFLPE